MQIRLTRKLADRLNGFDLRGYTVGEVVELDDPLARMLILECWAEEAVPLSTRATADERSRPVNAKARPKTSRDGRTAGRKKR